MDGLRSRGNVSPTTSTTKASVLNVRSNNSVSGDVYSDTGSNPSFLVGNPELSNPRVEQVSSKDLKTTKFTVLLNERAKRKGRSSGEGKNDVRVESSEFQLLVKLFIPPLYLIRNDKLTVKQLSTYLPILINGTLPKLNFELHLFLISIVTNYVSSWYKKLNTDNLEFIHHVYSIICEFVKKASRRISSVVELYELMSLLDGLAGVLDQHLHDVADNKECPIRVVNQYNDRMKDENVLVDVKSSLEIIADYLASQHIIFDPEILGTKKESLNYYDGRFDTGNPDDSDSIMFQSPAQKQQSHLMYFRILVKKILLETFQDGGPTSSLITMNLVILLLSDLVLDKVFNMLASPTFILEIIDKIADSLLQESKPVVKPKPTSYYNTIKSFMGKIRGIFRASPPATDELNILDSSIFSLVNTVFNISDRKPILFHFISAAKSVISSNSYLSTELNSRMKQFICCQIRSSGALKDESLANVVRTIKQGLFLDEEKVPKPPVDISELTEKIFTLTRVRFPQKYPLVSHETFYFQNETDDDIKASIHRFLSVFSFETDKGECDLNKLLVIRWLDVVISHLYPELVD